MTSALGTALRVYSMLGNAEAEALHSALAELRAVVAESGHAPPTFQVVACQERTAIPPPATVTLIITSLLREMDALDEPMASIETRLRRELAALASGAGARLFLCTIFRRIDPAMRRADPAGATRILERIRRLDLLAAELSHDYDINIIDFDRAFADVGGRVLATDFRFGGPAALALGRRVILSTLLAAGLDDVLAPEIQDTARAIIERRGRDRDEAARSAKSADQLGFGEAFVGPRPQRYAPISPTSRTIRSVLRNWRRGHVTSAETFRIVKRGIHNRLGRR